jgi:Domain of unknown function (DUF1996)/F5/8 type C domain
MKSHPDEGPPSHRRSTARARHRTSVIAGAAVLALSLGVAVSVLSARPDGSHAPADTLLASDARTAAHSARARSAGGAAVQGTAVRAAAVRHAAADTLLSQGMPAYASSTQDPQVYPAWSAVDGDPGTLWASAWSDPQWLKVNLLAVDTIHKVVLNWEAAYARAFKIQTSLNGRTWTTIYSTTTGTGGVQTLRVSGRGRWVRMYGTARGTGYGYSLWEFQVYGKAGPRPSMMPPPPFSPNLDPGESIIVRPRVQGIKPDQNFVYPSYVTHYEFQTDCTVFKDRQNDPIVYPRMENHSAHMHSFMGALSTNAYSTTDSLSRSKTSCLTPEDHSGYWFPTLYAGRTAINPVGPQVIYYKSGIYDYRTVRPFPKGLRFVVGNDMATEAQFQQSRGTVEGWECGNTAFHWTFPKYCPPGSHLVIRYQAPSCWDGVHLDVPNHQGNMAYPIHIDGKLACPAGHPVAVPMLEFKIAFPVSGNLSAMHLHLASGPAYTWHYDFFDAWSPKVLAALVKHCINGGLQCDTHGYDQYLPQFGAVLGPNYQLLR